MTETDYRAKHRCDTCAKWAPYREDSVNVPDSLGDCRHAAPRASDTGRRLEGGLVFAQPVWPATYGREWCHDYKPRAEVRGGS